MNTSWLNEGAFHAPTEDQALIGRVHAAVMARVDFRNLDKIPETEWPRHIGPALDGALEQEHVTDPAVRQRLAEAVRSELFGYGPLEPLLADPTISDILVNGHAEVQIERAGQLENTPIRFRDDAHLRNIIEKIVSAVGRRIDESTPMVDARLPDGSRVNAIIPPLALDGPCLSIRRFGRAMLQPDALLRNGTLTDSALVLLQAAVRGRLNVLISGGAGAGKTTLLGALSRYMATNLRVITIEDAAELQLQRPGVVRLETRPPNIEGKGAVRQRQLVINALRMRPDIIIVGEVRSEEAVDMLQAMNTGHDGSMATIHANSPREALLRLETMVAMANLHLPPTAIRQQIASAIPLVVQIERLSDGRRQVVALDEIIGMEGSVISMQPIFTFEKHGLTDRGRVLGELRATGIRPRLADRLRAAGLELPSDLFEDHRGGPSYARTGGFSS